MLKLYALFNCTYAFRFAPFFIQGGDKLTLSVMGSSSPGNSITGIVEDTSADSPQKRCATPVTVTHFTDRGKIEKVSELSVFNNDNLNSLTSFSPELTVSVKENNNNPFVGNSTTTITNPFHSESNPFLTSFRDEEEQKEEVNGNIDDAEEIEMDDKNDKENEREKIKVCLLFCIMHVTNLGEFLYYGYGKKI